MIGPSGSGKSTFLRMLNQLETPDNGTIIVDGFNISDEFSHRSTRFFPVRDCNNCLRHYEAIYKLEKEKRV